MLPSKRQKLNIYVFLTALILAIVTWPVAVKAQEFDDINFTDDPNLPEEPHLLGTIEGTGTYFKVNNSNYLNITLQSSQPIHLRLESIPKMIIMDINSAEAVTSTLITLSGFSPETTYYKYQDDYHQLEELTMDTEGTCTYTQDLSEPHLVFIQPTQSTIFLSYTGWSDPSVGTWDSATLTGTLTTDVFETIQIGSSGIELDGNNHTISGSGTGFGILVTYRAGLNIKNVNVEGFTYGIGLLGSKGNILTGNTASNNFGGFLLHSSNENSLAENTASNNTYAGFYIYSSAKHNMLTGNTALNNDKYGFFLYRECHANTLTGNTADSNGETGIMIYGSYVNTLTNNKCNNNMKYSGIHVYDSRSNTLVDNTANSNKGTGILVESSLSDSLSSNTVSGNSIGIYQYSSRYGTLNDNVVSLNHIGIRIYGDDCDFINNIISNNYHGFYLLENSDGNIFKYNTILENNYGVTCYKSYSNYIFNNNFIDNTTQAQAGYYLDKFNLGPPTFGNYWSNWTSPDYNNDGIVDRPYNFVGGRDYYPWTTQNGWNQPPVATITGPASGSIHALADGILLEGSIDDPDIGTGDTHTALWTISNEDWIEDFELEGTVTGTSVSDMLYFSEAGIYNIVLTVTDSKGASDTTTTVNNQEDMPAFVVIYDPDGGFVTGGGWIWSPLGAYVADSTLEGQANFGFVSKYKKGATVPTGSTEFQFQAGDLNFHSSEYDWLVVTGNNKAKFKGTGTINGQGIYRFMIWAGDSDLDTFRIRIWTEDEVGIETDVYDNGDENQVIGGGSIVIHNPK